MTGFVRMLCVEVICLFIGIVGAIGADGAIEAIGAVRAAEQERIVLATG